MVDHYSDYIELDSLSGNTTANSVISNSLLAMRSQMS